MQTVIVIGPGKLAWNIGYLTTTALPGSGTITASSGFNCRSLVPWNRWMREAICIIQPADGSNKCSQICWEHWRGRVRVKNAPIWSEVIIDGDPKDLFYL